MRYAEIIHETERPLAVIVKGNPKYLRNPKVQPMADAFYAEIKQLLIDKGFRVALDPGKPYTAPNENAKVWIAHSRGIDRLRFAPQTVRTIALQTKDRGDTYESNDVRAADPMHYQLSDVDLAAINNLTA
jgi:hypothetical protein